MATNQREKESKEKEMIPLSVVDALLTSKEKRLNELEDKAHWCLEVEIDLLKTIKKEAISIPEANKTTLEQQIRDRIKQLESKRNDPKRVEGFNAREKAIFEYGVSEVIDELRKLLK